MKNDKLLAFWNEVLAGEKTGGNYRKMGNG